MESPRQEIHSLFFPFAFSAFPLAIIDSTKMIIAVFIGAIMSAITGSITAIAIALRLGIAIMVVTVVVIADVTGTIIAIRRILGAILTAITGAIALIVIGIRLAAAITMTMTFTSFSVPLMDKPFQQHKHRYDNHAAEQRHRLARWSTTTALKVVQLEQVGNPLYACASMYHWIHSRLI